MFLVWSAMFMKKSLEKILAEVFGVKEEEISDATSPDNLSNWDSFNGLRLFEALIKEYGIKLSIEDLGEIKNVGDIKTILRKHKINV